MEIIIVITLMGILAGVLTPIISYSTRAYIASQARSELTARSRLALQRLAREIRVTVPNSIKLNGSGSEITFVTSKAGGMLLREDDTRIFETNCPANQRFRTATPLSQLCLIYPATTPFFVDGDLFVIGNSTPALLSSGDTTFAATAVTHSSLLWKIAFTSKSFTYDSPSSRFMVIDSTHRLRLMNGALYWRSESGFSSALYDLDSSQVSSSHPMLIHGIANSTIFNYQAGIEDLLKISLSLQQGDELITIEEQIDVRISY
ncbi:MAG: type II secretion system protein [Gammaproteobacteria bacterium]|nr:type II secretion system protein [Gammaproteobacteria bacterium]